MCVVGFTVSNDEAVFVSVNTTLSLKTDAETKNKINQKLISTGMRAKLNNLLKLILLFSDLVEAWPLL